MAEDAAAAVQWYRRAADLGDVGAMKKLAVCCAQAIGVAKDDAAAAGWYRRAADLGDTDAMVSLGRYMSYADGAPEAARDAVGAAKWFRKAAELGSASAMVQLGRCFADGVGERKDEAAAAQWYLRAANLGDASAMLALGGCCAHGRGVAADEAQAVTWYRKAAELGKMEAMFNLGICHEHGRGVAPDAVQAAAWYRQAAELGEGLAMYNLGSLYARGSGVAKDPVQHVHWFRKAADCGVPEAMHNLGVSYERGDGVARDAAVAVDWYRKAAHLGDAQAMASLAECYRTGRGVTKDLAEATAWYRRAADLGSPNAMANLGVSYANGTGVAQNRAQALNWLRRAAAQGHSGAMLTLGDCSKNYAEAARWYQQAADRGSVEAMRKLAFCYTRGMGVDQDDIRAASWFRKAAELDGGAAAAAAGERKRPRRWNGGSEGRILLTTARRGTVVGTGTADLLRAGEDANEEEDEEEEEEAEEEDEPWHLRRPTPSGTRSMDNRWEGRCTDCGDDASACPNNIPQQPTVIEAICTFRVREEQLFAYAEVPTDATEEDVVGAILARLSTPLLLDLVKLSCLQVSATDPLPFLEDAPIFGKYYFNPETNPDDERTQRWSAFLSDYVTAARPQTRATVGDGPNGVGATRSALIAHFRAAGAPIDRPPGRLALEPMAGYGYFGVVEFRGVPTDANVTLCTVGLSAIRVQPPRDAGGAGSWRYELCMVVTRGEPTESRAIDALYAVANEHRAALVAWSVPSVPGEATVGRFPRHCAPSPTLPGYLIAPTVDHVLVPATSSTIALLTLVPLMTPDIESILQHATVHGRQAAAAQLWTRLCDLPL